MDGAEHSFQVRRHEARVSEGHLSPNEHVFPQPHDLLCLFANVIFRFLF